MSLDSDAFDGVEGTIPRKGPGSTPGALPFERFSELPFSGSAGPSVGRRIHPTKTRWRIEIES